MKNFVFNNPTKLIFGKDTIITRLRAELPTDKTILVTFGGGSVRKNGVYDQVIKTLEGLSFVEFWGIEPNPKVETIRKAVAMGREHHAGFVLAVGGGSVIDASKLIAGAIPSERDAWDIVLSGKITEESLPLGTVLTIPATGSEMNSGGVISSIETKQKFGFSGAYPRFSVLDPTVTFSLPAYQVSCGIADTFVHVMEQYLTTTGQSRLMDRWAEGILLSLKELAPIIKEDPQNYDARADLMLCATMALNDFIRIGVTQDWSTHAIGHEITALTGLTHGHTLAIVLPGTMRVLSYTLKREKTLQYAERIWHITEGTEDERITAAIEATEQFFRSLDLPTRLNEMNIGREVSDEIVRRFAERDVKLGEAGTVDAECTRKILESCY